MTEATLETTEIASLGDIVRVHAANRENDAALILDDQRMTWGELYERSCRVANGLAAAGVGPQDRVAFLDKNGFEHFDVLFGAALLNAVCVDVNWRLAPPEVQFIVDDAGAKVLVVGPDFVPIIDTIADQFPTVEKILVIGGHATLTDDEFFVFEYPAGLGSITSSD